MKVLNMREIQVSKYNVKCDSNIFHLLNKTGIEIQEFALDRPNL